jgi:hypothetical protein
VFHKENWFEENFTSDMLHGFQKDGFKLIDRSLLLSTLPALKKGVIKIDGNTANAGSCLLKYQVNEINLSNKKV